VGRRRATAGVAARPSPRRAGSYYDGTGSPRTWVRRGSPTTLGDRRLPLRHVGRRAGPGLGVGARGRVGSSWVVFRVASDVIGWAPVAPGLVVGASMVDGTDAGAEFLVRPRAASSSRRGSGPARFPPRRHPVSSRGRIPSRRAFVSRTASSSTVAGARGAAPRHRTPGDGGATRDRQGLGPRIRTSIAVDGDARARRDPRLSGTRADRGSCTTARAADDGTAGTARAVPVRGGRTAASTAYDEIDGTDRPVAGRAVHQEAPARCRSSTGPGGARRKAGPGVRGQGRPAPNVTSERLASLERLDRGRARRRQVGSREEPHLEERHPPRVRSPRRRGRPRLL
jgi:hypothetical protein